MGGHPQDPPPTLRRIVRVGRRRGLRPCQLRGPWQRRPKGDTTSAAKADDALALGAHEVVISSDDQQMAAQANRFDLLLDTVPAVRPMTPLVQALTTGGTLCSVGVPDTFDVAPFALVLGRKSIAGAGAGGTAENREMLDFCVQHEITADIELIGREDINTALDRLAASDVKYRFVIDLAT